MFYWSPTNTEIERWQPKSGWNSVFSEKDKIQCTNLFFFFKNKKGFKENKAETLSQMILYKQKYNGLKYSCEQEDILLEALKPIFNC
jgi:hypothetical protein